MDEVRLDIAEVASGEVLAGKYRIEQKLGEGGMGVVYAATHLALDQPVAIKLLRTCLLYTSPSPRDRTRSRMPSSA